SCSSEVANAVALNPSQPKGQQVFGCHDNGDGTKAWYGVNDEADLQAEIASLTTNSATAAQLNAEITRAEAAEATLTTNLNNEIARAEGAESTLTTNLAGEVSRAQVAEIAASNAAAAAQSTANAAAAAASMRAEEHTSE